MEVAPDVDDALRNPKKLAICSSSAFGAAIRAKGFAFLPVYSLFMQLRQF